MNEQAVALPLDGEVERDETSAAKRLAALIARVRNKNLATVAESAHALFAMLRADPVLYGQISDKLVQGHCLETMRMHFQHASLVMWKGAAAPRIALHRVAQVRTEALAHDLRVAARQMRERLMNFRICGGNIQLRDAYKADIQQHCYFIRRQIEGEMQRLRFFEAIAAQMRDGERVYQRFTEDDLLALRAEAMDAPAQLAR